MPRIVTLNTVSSFQYFLEILYVVRIELLSGNKHKTCFLTELFFIFEPEI
jgi:hypothetical protein